MATPIQPTPPLRGKDAKAVLRALNKPGAPPEEVARRVELSRQRLASVMGIMTSPARRIAGSRR